MQSLRKLLRGAREAVGLSQLQLAGAVGVSARTIGRLEVLEEDVRFEVIALVRDHFEKMGLKFLPPQEGKPWIMVFPSDLAPRSFAAADIGGLFRRVPGSVLRAARASLQASQEELSQKTGLAHTTIRLLERSDPAVSANRAFKYQTYFQQTEAEIVAPDEVFGWRLLIKPGS